MIVPMRKYQFLVYHTDYERFINGLRKLGVLHIRERQGGPSAALLEKVAEQGRVRKALQSLRSREVEAQPQAKPSLEEGEQALAKCDELTQRLEPLRQQLALLRKEEELLKPWGAFSIAAVAELEEAGFDLHFYTCPTKKYQPEWEHEHAAFPISAQAGDTYFVVIAPKGEAPTLTTELLPRPKTGTVELEAEQAELKQSIAKIKRQLDKLAAVSLPSIERVLTDLEDTRQLMQVVEQTGHEADNQLLILEGYAPKERHREIAALCELGNVLFLSERPSPEEPPPVLLQNSAFSRLFEPIGRLFALPGYQEMDLTPFFAPFFMLFFGFCLGDAGYGLVMLIGATLFKWRAGEALKPPLTLVQFLGVGTILFGMLTGTIFGLNLLEDEFAWLGQVRNFMIDGDQAFNLALILGLVQIIFGLSLKGVNGARQYGWAYAIAPLGWILLLLSLVDIGVLEALSPYSTYTAWGSVGLILLFSAPKAGLFGRLGKGLLELYGITGIFGDLLSYIRLFALGIASAILGFVVNDIGLKIYDSAPYIGPVLFVLFLIVGHTANLLVASLGAFVHPMRLTFVEFYKNAGFAGGGKPYEPLKEAR